MHTGEWKRTKQNRVEYIAGNTVTIITHVRVALRAANSRGGDSLAKFTIELSGVEPEVAGRDAFAVVLNQKLPVHTLR